MKQPIVAITMGDPAGIGPEILVKAMLRLMGDARFLIIGDARQVQKAADLLGQRLRLTAIKQGDKVPEANGCYIIDMKNVDEYQLDYGKPNKSCGYALVDYIKTAVALSMQGLVDAIVTCPINKTVMRAAGYHYPGHTELLAELTDSHEYAMMMVGGGLRITLLSIHTALKNVPDLVLKERVERMIRLTDESLKKLWGIETPRIAVAGLNPHAGEGGMFGTEDSTEILPAVMSAVRSGIAVDGPIPADTLFYRALNNEFDAEVAMYHDQGLIPLKTVAFDTGVNVTLGLPIIRTSVDHGTAYDIAGTGKGSDSSLLEAIRLATLFAVNSR